METFHYPQISETLYTETLANGLTVQVIPKPGYARRFALLAVRCGGADRVFELEGRSYDTPAGVAHFLEHKMFDMPGGGNALQLLSARGAAPNAFTSGDTTAYYFSCTDGFEANLRTLLEFVSTPYFTEETVAREQGIIGQEIRMGDDTPHRALYYGMLRSLYHSNPVREPVIGSADSIGRITPDTLYACHRAFYRPANMVLCCVGDIDPAQVAAIAGDILPPEAHPAPRPSRGRDEDGIPAQSFVRREMAVAAPLFMLGAAVPLPERGQKQLRLRITGELTLQTLFGHTAPFYSRLYADGLLSRNYGCQLDCVAGTATAVLLGESPDPEAVRRALTGQVDRVRNEGLDPGLFNRSKKAYYGSELRGLGRFDGLARAMAQGHFHGWSPLDVFALLEDIRPEDCADFAVRWLAPSRLALSVVAPGH